MLHLAWSFFVFLVFLSLVSYFCKGSDETQFASKGQLGGHLNILRVAAIMWIWQHHPHSLMKCWGRCISFSESCIQASWGLETETSASTLLKLQELEMFLTPEDGIYSSLQTCRFTTFPWKSSQSPCPLPNPTSFIASCGRGNVSESCTWTLKSWSQDASWHQEQSCEDQRCMDGKWSNNLIWLCSSPLHHRSSRSHKDHLASIRILIAADSL